jgi:hypothetical protein
MSDLIVPTIQIVIVVDLRTALDGVLRHAATYIGGRDPFVQRASKREDSPKRREQRHLSLCWTVRLLTFIPGHPHVVKSSVGGNECIYLI